MDEIIKWASENAMQAAVVAVAALVLVFVIAVIVIKAIKGAKKADAVLDAVKAESETETADKGSEIEAREESETKPDAAAETEETGEETKEDAAEGSEDEKRKKSEDEKPSEELTEVKVEDEIKVEKSAKQVKTPAKKAAVAEKEEPKDEKKLLGKWVAKKKAEKEFVAFLYASNGQVMLTSETYSSAEGAKNGVQTIKKNVAADNFQIYCDKNRHYYFKVKTSQNRFLCAGETYPTRAACESAMESVKRFVDSPVSDLVEEDLTVIKYEIPSDEEPVTAKKGFDGKWLINPIENMYMAQLYASNGQLLLSSEAYSSADGAKTAIANITANGIKGNFIIDGDKRGRYFFKLRNAQKSTLCVGESYAEQSSCLNAIESVRRFLQTAKLVESAPQKDPEAE